MLFTFKVISLFNKLITLSENLNIWIALRILFTEGSILKAANAYMINEVKLKLNYFRYSTLLSIKY